MAQVGLVGEKFDTKRSWEQMMAAEADAVKEERAALILLLGGRGHLSNFIRPSCTIVRSSYFDCPRVLIHTELGLSNRKYILIWSSRKTSKDFCNDDEKI